MKQQVIVVDVGGYTERLRALRDAHPYVVGITTPDKDCEGFAKIGVRDEWLKSDDAATLREKYWHNCGTLGLSAVIDLGINADAYWFIESDCVASQARWKAVFAEHADNDTDALFVCPKSRNESLWNPWWTHLGTPSWADSLAINCIYRLSRRALEVYADCAEELRECFGEVAIGSCIKRAGLSIGRINNSRDVTHYNNQTIKSTQERVILDRKLINHPIKENTYAP